MNYIAIMHKDQGSDYGVSFPDFPGCITAGSTLDEAKELALEALTLHISGMKDDGEAIPSPSSLDAIMEDDDYRSGVAFIVPYQPAARTVRINISVAENDLAAIDTAARSARLSRSAFIVKSALEHA